MPKQLLRPGWVLTHLVVIAIAVSFVSLGMWQVRRHYEQAEENTRVEAQLASEPAPVGDALGSPDIDLLPVSATGTFDADEQLQLAPRSRNERPGFEVLTPLRLDDGRALLVNRGWMPLDSELPAPPTGEVTVVGRLRTPFDTRQVLTDDAGTITGVYTVLVEGDDFNEPVADAVRSILDGHIVLTRDLATAGHFPAVDVLESVSRLRDRVLPVPSQRVMREIQRLMACYRDKEDLIAVGAYQEGTDTQVDLAICMRPTISDFLRQDPDDLSDWNETLASIAEVSRSIDATKRSLE